MKKTKKGFTLIELIVVLAILAVIAAIAVPTAFGSINKAKQAADRASVDAYNSAVTMQTGLLKVDATIVPADNTVTAAVTAANMTATNAQINGWVTVSEATALAPLRINYFVTETEADASITAGATTKTAITSGTPFKTVLGTGAIGGKELIDTTP